MSTTQNDHIDQNDQEGWVLVTKKRRPSQPQRPPGLPKPRKTPSTTTASRRPSSSITSSSNIKDIDHLFDIGFRDTCRQLEALLAGD